MTFIVAWSFKPEQRNAVQARFKQTGGRPPAGIKMLGRWHGVGTNKGVAVAEAKDSLAMAKWAQEWSDLMSFDIYPVMTDEETAKSLA